jgi:tRNA/tmRNA/rRNA uracil-C5-methylase (TrmA/RlmC/RlmD family)
MTLGELIARMSSGTSTAPDAEREGEKTSYMVASAGEALKAGQALGANVLLVDPPRKGLEYEVLEELCKPFNAFQDYIETKTMLTIPDDKVNWTNDVETLVYVSCGFDALARDSERLLSSRAGWMLKSATGYVLFPGSDHVETVAVFERELR